MLPVSEANRLVESARIQLTEAWQLLQGIEPNGDDYSTLRLITNDVKVWQKNREGENG